MAKHELEWKGKIWQGWSYLITTIILSRCADGSLVDRSPATGMDRVRLPVGSPCQQPHWSESKVLVSPPWLNYMDQCSWSLGQQPNGRKIQFSLKACNENMRIVVVRSMRLFLTANMRVIPLTHGSMFLVVGYLIMVVLTNLSHLGKICFRYLEKDASSMISWRMSVWYVNSTVNVEHYPP